MEKLWPFFLNDKNNISIDSLKHGAKYSVQGPYASMLKNEEDVLWACGKCMIANKMPIPVRSNDSVQRLILLPTFVLRKEPIFENVESLNQTRSARLGIDRLFYFHIINNLVKGIHTLSIESYAFLGAILHCLFNPKNSKLLDKSEMFRTLKTCVPFKTLNLPGSRSMMLRNMKNHVVEFSKSEKYSSEHFQTAFIQYVKSFPFFASTRFENISVEIESRDGLKRFRGTIIINTNGIFLLKRKTSKLVSYITYSKITAVALSDKDHFFQFMTKNMSIRISAKWSVCKDCCRALSGCLSCLMRSNDSVADINPNEVTHRWETDNIFPGTVVPAPPRIEMDVDFLTS